MRSLSSSSQAYSTLLSIRPTLSCPVLSCTKTQLRSRLILSFFFELESCATVEYIRFGIASLFSSHVVLFYLILSRLDRA